MSKTEKILAAVAAVIFLASALWCVVSYFTKKGGTVTVSQEGTILYTLDLSSEPDRVITVEYGGRTNLIEIKDGRIRVSQADCPDQVCVDTGWLEELPIICLPNRLVIEYSDTENEDTPDAQVG